MKQPLQKLKPRQEEIINSLLKFRFLNTNQIQNLLHHKHKEKVIEWLKKLTNDGYICRFYKQEFAGKPAVYCLDTKSVSFLKEKQELEISEKLLKRIYKEKTRSSEFKNKHLFLADIFLSITKFTKSIQATLNFYTGTDLYGMKGLITPNPDAYFSILDTTKQRKGYFLDVFDEFSETEDVKKRIRQYIKYYESNEWQDNTEKPFPEILLICPNDRIQKRVYWYIERRLNELPDLHFYLSTWEEIKTMGIRRETLRKVEISRLVVRISQLLNNSL